MPPISKTGTRLLHDNLWKTVGHLASKSKRRRAAVAYFTTDLIGFRKGDLLVTDASELAVKRGSTSAKALRKLFDAGVEIRACPSLHAKMLVFGNHAFVGSANLSETSRDYLNEAGILTDSTRIVHEVEAVVLRLASKSTLINESRLEALEAIEPDPMKGSRHTKKRGIRIGRNLATTWLIRLHDEAPEEGSVEEDRLERAAKEARELKANPRSYPDAFWYDRRMDSFAEKVRTGDRLITIWSEEEKSTPTEVYRNTLVTKVRRDNNYAYVSTEDYPGWRKDEITWKRFVRIAKQVGLRLSEGKEVKGEIAADIDELWKLKR